MGGSMRISMTQHREIISVGELRALLDGLHDDMPVILSKDAEGNAYHWLRHAERSSYSRDGFDVTVYHPDDVMHYNGPDAEWAMVLWP